MSHLYVHRSNRVEALFEALCEIVATPLAHPFAAEQVVVHSQPMGAWLSLRLAERFGVWANGRFAFPRRFVHDLLTAVLSERATSVEWFTRERLLWAVLCEVTRQDAPAQYAELRVYIERAGNGAQFDLCSKIADLFERYTLFRPEQVLAWERGEGDDWQAHLWRAIGSRVGGEHIARVAAEFVATLADKGPLAGIPERVTVFGISTLPPLYLRILAAVAERCPVHLFVVSPSREYWGDTPRRRTRSEDEDLVVPALLQAWGAVGRDFQEVLENEVDYHEPDVDRYFDPGCERMLGALQSDMVHFARPQAELRALDADDDSISIHACHSPMREVEVLHDQLLEWFARDPTLVPRDVVVMMSDVETYAPLVEAVFGRSPDDPTCIPHAIADRPLQSQSPPLEALDRAVTVAQGRITASEVLDLLALEPIRTRFGISADDVKPIAAWVAQSGVRWGLDGSFREAHGYPCIDSNTWRFGLDRLLLGHALPCDGPELFAGVLPYDKIEGQSAALLGQFADFCRRLFALAEEVTRPRTIDEWVEVYARLIDTLVATRGPGGAIVFDFRAALHELAEQARAVGLATPLPLHTVHAIVMAKLKDDAPPRGFFSGGVTFCGMRPMRALPFRVVCLLGMGDRQFPRCEPTLGFDKMAQSPRPGDRSRRNDDRYLCLEALLSCRERLIVCYVGQSLQDNAVLPPSVVVSELLDELAERYRIGAAGEGDLVGRQAAIRERLTVHHRMQPFSPRYFDDGKDPRLFSYEQRYCNGAIALRGERIDAGSVPWMAAPFEADAAAGPASLTLERLIAFLRSPSADLLRQYLEIYYERDEDGVSDHDPIEPTGLEKWQLGTEMIALLTGGASEEQVKAYAEASGLLAAGAPGAARFAALMQDVVPIVGAVTEMRSGGSLPNLEVELPVEGTLLTGTLCDRFHGGIVQAQYGELRAKQLLAAWVRHLALCMALGDASTTTIVCREKKTGTRICRLVPVADPKQHLGRLVDRYWTGRTEPVLLFPESAWMLCNALAAGESAQQARQRVHEAFTRRRTPDANDPYVLRLYGTREFWRPGFSLFEGAMRAGDFERNAVEVFGPIKEHLRES